MTTAGALASWRRPGSCCPTDRTPSPVPASATPAGPGGGPRDPREWATAWGDTSRPAHSPEPQAPLQSHSERRPATAGVITGAAGPPLRHSSNRPAAVFVFEGTVTQDEWLALNRLAGQGDEDARAAVKEFVHQRARAAAAETAWPDFTETSRPSRKVTSPACSSEDCDRPIPADGRSDREFCSERCAHRERQRRLSTTAQN